MDIKPEWRTATVVSLCQAMREQQDFSALPILADAVEDAGCDDPVLLARLRGPSLGYAEDAAVTACLWSAAGAESVKWLRDYGEHGMGPSFEPLFCGAAGRVSPGPAGYEYLVENDGEYLLFLGRDAYGNIPDGFWDHMETASGLRLTKRPRYFSCSC